ncbi:hypothetical protein BpHYR1_004215 [Brachionus plicatilis]|uniref:Uncharacterized protein n=1 Tax=Brachionus plicatilis TaxID=10195 RepID=A0A3M7P6D5_BRAPC|nr:hypothetical protein BpHYR1_004215 [Brachionus plicatilis]
MFKIIENEALGFFRPESRVSISGIVSKRLRGAQATNKNLLTVRFIKNSHNFSIHTTFFILIL